MAIAFSSVCVGDAAGDGEMRVFLLAFSGDLDADGLDDLTTALALALDEGPGAIFVDLRELGAVGARGIACLIGARQRAEALGIHLAVIGGAPPAHRVLSLADAESIDELIRCISPVPPPRRLPDGALMPDAFDGSGARRDALSDRPSEDASRAVWGHGGVTGSDLANPA